MTESQLSNLEQLPFANYKMEIRYDGEKYYGWQRHDGHPTIQAALEDAVTKCFGLWHNIEGSGRTDRGAHAMGQVATLRLPENIDVAATVKSLNEALDVFLFKFRVYLSNCFYCLVING